MQANWQADADRAAAMAASEEEHRRMLQQVADMNLLRESNVGLRCGGPIAAPALAGLITAWPGAAG